MQNVINAWVNVALAFMNDLFSNYAVVSGVTFGWFLLAVLILAIVISFLLNKVFRWR